MNTLVVYDTSYGNTAKVAQAIVAALPGGAAIHPIAELDPAALPRIDLLVVGSPTQGGRPTAAMQAWLDGLPDGRLAFVDVVAFDTRLAAAEKGLALRTLMGFIGYAAPRILKALVSKGGSAIAPPEGLIVEGKEGPLRAGELERAAGWITRIESNRWLAA